MFINNIFQYNTLDLLKLIMLDTDFYLILHFLYI